MHFERHAEFNVFQNCFKHQNGNQMETNKLNNFLIKHTGDDTQQTEKKHNRPTSKIPQITAVIS